MPTVRSLTIKQCKGMPISSAWTCNPLGDMSIKARFTDEPLWLMDGSAFIFRGFYANQAMTRADGMPTGALYIVARIILRILREERPSHFAFVLDGRGKNFRHERFALYKANRDATPEGLVAQIEPIQRLVRALGLRLEVSAKCEADDCIASLAARYSPSRPVVIIGADKDLRQCLNDNVLMWDPAGKDEKIITLDSFTAETGLAPEQWPDLQALVGDASDNIPGIPGIGPKTAEKLLLDYPRLEAIRDGFADLPETLRKKFAGRLDDMFLYRELTTLLTSCCPDVDLESLRLKPVRVAEAEAVLREFELPSIERELASLLRSGVLTAVRNVPLPSTSAGPSPAQGARQFSLLEAPVPEATAQTTPESVAVADLPDCTGQDVALLPLALPNARPESIWIGLPGKGMRYTGSVAAVIPWLRAARRVIVPDLKALWRYEPAWRQLPVERWHDLGVAAYLVNPEEGDVSWPRLVSRFLGTPAAALPAPAEQAMMAVALAAELDRHLHAAHLETLLTQLEMPLIPVLADMELAGVCLDQAALADFLREVQAELSRLTLAVHEAAGDALHGLGAFNIRSSQQLGVLLFERLGLPRSGKTRGGQARTDQEALEKLQGRHPIIDALLDYRKLEKMRSTYLEPLPRLMGADGRIRTTFNQTATATGRLSSSSPNLQNIPIRGELGRRMRTCFTAAPGMLLVSADYSQIELRVLAHLSQEPALLTAFREGADIHAHTASLLFNKPQDAITADERRNAKTINFGLIYGMGPQSLAKSLGISLNEAKSFITRYFSQFSRLKDFYDNAEQLARGQGFVTSLAGRRRLLPDIHSDNNQIRSQARRQAINTMVQGSAADIIKLAMLAVYHDPMLRSLNARLLLQVHDELLLEAPESQAEAVAKRVAERMASVRPGSVLLDVPLLAEAGVGRNWGEAH